MLKTALKKRSYMTKRDRSDKSRYKHQSTGDYCTCAAYLAEMMCLRLAQKKGVSGLSYKFWNKKPWDWTFKKQLFSANSLIKQYGEKAVLRAVVKMESVFSLNNKRILTEIKKQLSLIDKEEKKEDTLEVKKDAVQRKKTYGKKTGLNKLRGLDGKKESES